MSVNLLAPVFMVIGETSLIASLSWRCQSVMATITHTIFGVVPQREMSSGRVQIEDQGPSVP